MKTLAKVHDFKALQDFTFKTLPKPVGSHVLHKVHNDVRQINSQLATQFSNLDALYKQHVFPSPKNVQLLESVKKVVLLREPNEVILAYFRGWNKGVQSPLRGFKKVSDEKEWLVQAQNTGLTADIHFFYSEWKKIQDPNTLHITYSDYVQNPKAIINRIEQFYGIKETNVKIKAVRARYSREHSGLIALKRFFKSNRARLSRFKKRFL